MSVVNEFDADNIRYSLAEKRVYVVGNPASNVSFSFNFFCKRSGMPASTWFFFNVDKRQVLVVIKLNPTNYKCLLMGFWVQNDQPILSAQWFTSQESILNEIAEDFRDKYAAHLLDGIVNS